MVNQQRISGEFMHQAAIDSPSFHEAAMAEYLKQRLEKLGATVKIDDAGEKIGSDTGNLIALIPGKKRVSRFSFQLTWIPSLRQKTLLRS